METVIKSIPYHLQAYELIKNAILTGKIASGVRINENKIAQELGISRSPVREALRMLERDNILVVIPSGLIVNPLPMEEIHEIYECRIALESYAVRLTAERIDDSNIAVLDQYITESRKFHKNHDITNVVEFNTKFHQLIIDLCGNSHLIELIDKNRDLSTISRSKEFFKYERGIDYLDEHKSILDALRTHNVELAEKEMRLHIANDLAFYTSQYYKTLED